MIVEQLPFRPKDPKPVLRTARDARLALAGDKLGCVYRRAVPGRGVVVFVVTVHGAGEFTAEEWEVSA